jgi:hypothetical protein
VGKNTLELQTPYGVKIDIEALYLLGDFGVTVQGSFCTLIPPVRSLAFGDITRQGLPFYGGNITYSLEAALPAQGGEIAVTCYRGHLLRLKAGGEDLGVIAYAPYRLPLRKAGDAKSRNIEILYFGSRINTFGQLHCNIRDDSFWWGPNSWRSVGPAWTYEYRFWQQGVLKSPEIYGN